MQNFAGKVILVVDDAPESLFLLSKALKKCGASVLAAQSVAEGLKLAKEKIPHLIITDLMLPEEDGFELLKKCSTIPEFSKLPVLVLSGLKNEASVHKAMALGATDYAIKSSRFEPLMQKIEKALGQGGGRSHSYTPESRPSVQVSIPVSLKMANETSILIESSIRMSADEEVKISTPELNEIGINEVIAHTMHPAGRFAGPGRFISRVRWIGLNNQIIKNMRKTLKTWETL